MQKFKEYLDLLLINIDNIQYTELEEGKQIGIIYHFTRVNNIKKLLNPTNELGTDIFEFISHNGVINTTRNYFASDNILIKNTDFDLCTYNIRIALDGDKISNKYRIRPLAGLNNNDTDVFNQDKNDLRVLRNSGEAEEAIWSKKAKSFKLLPYVKEIQIYRCIQDDEELFKDIQELVKFKNLNIPVNIVRKFRPFRLTESNIESNAEFYDIIYV